ncbi:hypothetical protein [Janibacter anophelis]|uniref:hypothetical protein n=1 Tax=Janibacter anophelis TaxID=319054 RepID=UPI0008305667|nr:hypothetical protein [Janibacter anophelis]
MRKMLALITGLLLSFGLVAASAGTASAAKPAPVTSTTVSPLLTLGNQLGLFTITADGGTTFDPATGAIVAEVVSNPAKSGVVVQKGSITLSKADGSSLTIKNIKYDIAKGEVTGVIDDVRVLLYHAEQTSETSAALTVAPEGGAIMREFVNFLGLPADGADFGTATLS